MCVLLSIHHTLLNLQVASYLKLREAGSFDIAKKMVDPLLGDRSTLDSTTESTASASDVPPPATAPIPPPSVSPSTPSKFPSSSSDSDRPVSPQHQRHKSSPNPKKEQLIADSKSSSSFQCLNLAYGC